MPRLDLTRLKETLNTFFNADLGQAEWIDLTWKIVVGVGAFLFTVFKWVVPLVKKYLAKKTKEKARIEREKAATREKEAKAATREKEAKEEERVRQGGLTDEELRRDLRRLRGDDPPDAETPPTPKPLNVDQMGCVRRVEAAGLNLEAKFLKVLKEWEEEGSLSKLDELDRYLEIMKVNVREARSVRLPDNGTEYTIKSLHENSVQLVQDFKRLLEERPHVPNYEQLELDSTKQPPPQRRLDLDSPSEQYLAKKNNIAQSFRDKLEAHGADIDCMVHAYQDVGMDQ